MFTNTSGTKNGLQLHDDAILLFHDDVRLLLREFAKSYENLAALVTGGKDAETEDAVVLALATKLDGNFKTFNELQAWYRKLAFGQSRQRRDP